jgi:DNA ligase D
MTRKVPDEVEVSRPEKLLWPEAGVTKAAYRIYLDAVADRMLPWLRDRPLSVIRAPDGVQAERYFQKATSPYAPPWIRRIEIPAPSAKRIVPYTVCNDVQTLEWLGNQAAVELHPAPVRRDQLSRPDWLVFDIDPPEGRFADAVAVARLVLEELGSLGLEAGVKTTGGKGLHVLVPIERRYGTQQIRDATAAITARVADREPDLVTHEFRKAKRGDRVMLDPSRNAPGATVVAPYSPRARAEATVSFPLVESELDAIGPFDFTIATVPSRLGGPGPRAWIELSKRRFRLPSSLVGRD